MTVIVFDPKTNRRVEVEVPEDVDFSTIAALAFPTPQEPTEPETPTE